MVIDPMEALKARFRLRCGNDLQLLKDLSEDPQGALVVEFAGRVHRLAGIAGALGYDALGEIAKTLDDALSHNVAASNHDIDRLRAELEKVDALS